MVNLQNLDFRMNDLRKKQHLLQEAHGQKKGIPIHTMKLLEGRIIIVLIITWDKGRNHGRARH